MRHRHTRWLPRQVDSQSPHLHTLSVDRGGRHSVGSGMILSGFLAEERCVRLTIFWRVIFAQLTLIALILGMSLYALFQLHHLAGLSTAILAIDSTSIEAEKRLLKVFLSQMRIA